MIADIGLGTGVAYCTSTIDIETPRHAAPLAIFIETLMNNFVLTKILPLYSTVQESLQVQDCL